MSSNRSKQGTSIPASSALPTGIPADQANSFPQPADVGLSAALRNVLGTRPGETHFPVPGLKQGQEVARLARSGKPASASKGTPRKSHIGPRSGHK